MHRILDIETDFDFAEYSSKDFLLAQIIACINNYFDKCENRDAFKELVISPDIANLKLAFEMANGFDLTFLPQTVEERFQNHCHELLEGDVYSLLKRYSVILKSNIVKEEILKTFSGLTKIKPEICFRSNYKSFIVNFEIDNQKIQVFLYEDSKNHYDDFGYMVKKNGLIYYTTGLSKEVLSVFKKIGKINKIISPEVLDFYRSI